MQRTGLLPQRIVHLHPTRRCNLACAHCYSSSAPDQRDALALRPLLDGLRHLREHGYSVLSLSGGEPLLYADVERLAEHAHGLGYRVNMISNGLALTERRLERIAPYIERIAISLDGMPSTHDAIRGRPGAFDGAAAAMHLLAAHGQEFGVALTATRASLRDLPALHTFAREHGAALLQIHPLARTGRAVHAAAWALDAAELRRLYVAAALLDDAGGTRVQLDLVPADRLRTSGAWQGLTAPASTTDRLGALINPLVINERGALLPYAYGVHPNLTIARLGEELAAGIARFCAGDGRAALHRVVRRALDLAEADPARYVEWYEQLVRASWSAEFCAAPHAAAP